MPEKEEKEIIPIKKVLCILIAAKGKTVIVRYEIDEEIKAVALPHTKWPDPEINMAKLDLDVLQKGIPYSLDWAKAFTNIPTAEKIANELLKRNIFTAEDALSSHKQVSTAIMSAFGGPIGQIMDYARKSIKK